MNLEVGDDFIDPGYTVDDNYWPLNALSVKTNSTLNNKVLGTTIIEYILTDGSGNTATITRSVNVVKQRKPLLSLNGSAIVSVHRFATFADEGVSIADNYYGSPALQSLLKYDFGQSGNKSSTFSTQNPGTFIITYFLTDPSGNSAMPITRQVEVKDDFLSVNELKSGEMKLYPVPTSNTLTVELNSKEHIKQVKVYDVFGKEVFEVKTTINGNKAEMDMQGKSAGIYLLNIETESTTYSKKFNVVK
ncbi:MAG: T9SS type A sorting domain-containing protein, partial [Bacteroidetes bacterium]|nr:T9SS type A sorting domain-containing protein [Bacteroidota bacterium]